MDYPFYDEPNTATIVCCHVIDDNEPILYVSHDEEDGMWQFLCGQAHETSEARLVSLKYAYEIDHTIEALKDMPYGYYAKRDNQEDDWNVTKKQI